MAEDGGDDVKRKMDELKAKLAEVNAERARRYVSIVQMLFAPMGQAREIEWAVPFADRPAYDC